MDCAIKTVNSNNGIFMCSTTDSITPKNGHVSHDAQDTATSCCAPTCLSPSAACKRKCNYLFRRDNHSAYIAVRIRACLTAHPPKRTHGSSCVLPNVSFCTELQWLTRVSLELPCPASFLRMVFWGVLPIVKVAPLVATNATIDHKPSCENDNKNTTCYMMMMMKKHNTFRYPPALP